MPSATKSLDQSCTIKGCEESKLEFKSEKKLTISELYLQILFQTAQPKEVQVLKLTA
jgi:hypothetical protein